MPRENYLRLRGIVKADPLITENKNGRVARVYINIARPDRNSGDGTHYINIDTPMIISKNPAMIDEIATWKKLDIVDIKGVLSSRQIIKASYCSHCRHKNKTMGSLVYVVANYAEKLGSLTSEKDSRDYLIARREVSNNIKIFGTLLREPKILSTFSGLEFTQYQIGINRKFRIKEDDPVVKSDFPWVKSYGENARLDRERLQKGSEVYIDGCLQTRSVQRKAYCGQLRGENGKYITYQNGNPVIEKDENGNDLGCGQEYYWVDRTLEIVPFSTEYISNFLSEEDAAVRTEARKAQSLKDRASSLLYGKNVFDELTEEDHNAGIDDRDEDFDGE